MYVDQPRSAASVRIASFQHRAILLILLFSLSQTIGAQTFSDSGFIDELVTTAAQYQTVGLTFAPDGRMFIWQKNGVVRIYQNGTLLEKPFLDISHKVNNAQDRGLLGLALDPEFEINGYVYLLYTFEPFGDPNSTDERTGRLTRVQADPANPERALPDSEIIILGSREYAPCSQYPMGDDCIGNEYITHASDTLRFGPDRKLYVSIGDGADVIAPNLNALRALNLDSYNGKVLRINTDGSGLPDNPFYNGDVNSIRSKVYSYGLRNPYRFSIDPQTGAVFVGDVGNRDIEELNSGRGANFGWPCFEGFGRFEDFLTEPICQALPDSAVTQPLYAYPHPEGHAVVVGPVYSGSQFPELYRGNLFFADYVKQWIRRMVFDEQGRVLNIENFATEAGGIVSLEQGPDGSLYYVDILTGQVRRIRYAGAPVAVVTASPTEGSSPLTVNFSSEGSGDSVSSEMSYLWDFGDGSQSSEAHPTHTYVSSTSTTFIATLTVTNAVRLSSSASVQITLGNNAPQVNVILPLEDLTVAPGTTVEFQADGSDSEDELSENAYRWQILLHHDDHIHPYSQGIGSRGSFVADDHGIGEYYYEIIMTVTDSGGASNTSRRRVFLTANQLPIVRLTSPANGLQFISPAEVVLTAEAADSDGVITRVDFWQGNTLIGSRTTSPYAITWSNIPVGEYQLTAKATDNRGGVTTSAAINLTVKANTPPQVRIVSPLTNSIIAASSNLEITAEAQDSDGIIQRVEFYQGNTLLATRTVSPWTLTLTSVAAGNYSFLARAIDDRGAVTDSQPVSLKVNQPPTIQMTTPVNGAGFVAPAVITIRADALDTDGTVNRVEIFNGTTLLTTLTRAPFSLTWSGVPAGRYALSARATDDNGANASSNVVAITVNDPPPNLPPVISLSTPANNSEFTAPATISLNAVATDNDGTISRVEFFNGATLLGTVVNAPFSFTLNNVPAGNYSLTARATDNSGAGTTSAPLTIKVVEPILETLPAVWANQDIGSVGKPGKLNYSSGAFTISSTGANWAGNRDAFHFVWQPLDGDGEIIARVTGFQTNDLSRAGVMIRERLTADSKYGMVTLNSSGDVTFWYRTTNSSPARRSFSRAANPPQWVRLVRRGTVLTSYYSSDGLTWEMLDTEFISFAYRVYIGLAVSSNNSSATATATLDQVNVK